MGAREWLRHFSGLSGGVAIDGVLFHSRRLGHEFGEGHGWHVGTDLARRAPARPDALTLTLAPRVARSLSRFYRATDFTRDLSGWVVNSVNGQNACRNFCLNAGFNNNPTSRIPSFPETCGTPGC